MGVERAGFTVLVRTAGRSFPLCTEVPDLVLAQAMVDWFAVVGPRGKICIIDEATGEELAPADPPDRDGG